MLGCEGFVNALQEDFLLKTAVHGKASDVPDKPLARLGERLAGRP